MIKNILIITGLLAQFSVIPAAFSMSCSKPITPYDETYCAALKMVQLDKEINNQYGKTLKVLNADQKKQLKHTQIEWIRERDKDCSRNGLVAVSCVNEKMETRVSLLKAVERECQSSGCDKELLSRVK